MKQIVIAGLLVLLVGCGESEKTPVIQPAPEAVVFSADEKKVSIESVDGASAPVAVIKTVDAAPVPEDRDDTDPPGGFSGFTLYTDNLTGCQYLGTRSGLVPRMDHSGRQVCR